MTRYIAIDTETTGVDKLEDQVVEFAAVDLSPFFQDGKVVDGTSQVKAINLRFKPTVKMKPGATKVNGITDTDLENEPSFAEKAAEIQEFLSGATLVAHNADFDKAMLKAEFKRCGIDFKAKYYCTLKNARKILPGLPSYKLEDLKERFNIHGGGSHNALDDAQCAGKLFMALMATEAEMPVVEKKRATTATTRKSKPEADNNYALSIAIVFGAIIFIAWLIN